MGTAKIPDLALADTVANAAIEASRDGTSRRVPAALATVCAKTWVISRTVTVPPSALEGARYIVPGSGATGAWVGHAHQIAEWLKDGEGNGAWYYADPAGMLRVDDEQVTVIWQSGTWTVLALEDGVTGPVSSVAGRVAVFADGSGKKISDSGKDLPAGAIVGTTANQTLTNKTLEAPEINDPTGLVKGDVGLSDVDNTADANKPVSSAQAAAIATRAPLASPTFTGTPAAPTPSEGDNSTKIATTAFAKTAVDAAVADRPTAPHYGVNGNLITGEGPDGQKLADSGLNIAYVLTRFGFTAWGDCWVSKEAPVIGINAEGSAAGAIYFERDLVLRWQVQLSGANKVQFRQIAANGTLTGVPLELDYGTVYATMVSLGVTDHIDLGNTDTPLARDGAGDIKIGANRVYRAGGARVSATDGGSGVTTGTRFLTANFDRSGTGVVATGLTADVVAGKKYDIEAVLHVNPDATGGCRFELDGSCTITSLIAQLMMWNNTSDALVHASRLTALQAPVGPTAGATEIHATIKGSAVIANSGTLRVDMGQVANSGTSTLLAGSTLTVREIP